MLGEFRRICTLTKNLTQKISWDSLLLCFPTSWSHGWRERRDSHQKLYTLLFLLPPFPPPPPPPPSALALSIQAQITKGRRRRGGKWPFLSFLTGWSRRCQWRSDPKQRGKRLDSSIMEEEEEEEEVRGGGQKVIEESFLQRRKGRKKREAWRQCCHGAR